MKLSILERLLIQNLLPEKGSYTNLKIIRVAREALSFNEQENKAFEFIQEGEQLKWKTKENVGVAIKNLEELLQKPDLAKWEKEKAEAQIEELKPKLALLENVPEERDIKLGEIVTEMIKKKLKEIDEKQELLPQQASLYEKFVEGEKAEVLH